MGQRTTQRILECAICKTTPDDGEYLWEMSGEHWCESCCDNDQPEIFEGTRDEVGALSIIG